jgi:hypothetical protein
MPVQRQTSGRADGMANLLPQPWAQGLNLILISNYRFLTYKSGDASISPESGKKKNRSVPFIFIPFLYLANFL